MTSINPSFAGLMRPAGFGFDARQRADGTDPIGADNNWFSQKTTMGARAISLVHAVGPAGPERLEALAVEILSFIGAPETG